MAKKKTTRIAQGETLPLVFNYGAQPLVYKSISAEVSAAPLTLTVTGHGAVDQWPVAISGIGFDAVDADDWPPDADDFFTATVTNSNTLSFNDIDLAQLDGTYTTGGSIAYYTPVDMAGASASLIVYDASGAVVLTIAATLDNTAKTISAAISAAQSLALTTGDYTYALWYTDSLGAKTEFPATKFSVDAPGTPSC